MGRAKTRNSDAQKILPTKKQSPASKSPSKGIKKYFKSKSPVVITKIAPPEQVAVQIIEPPLFQCRRCGNSYETSDEYTKHDCNNPIKPVIAVVEQATPSQQDEEQEEFLIYDINEPNITDKPAKKPRKPYKKRESNQNAKEKSPKKSSNERAQCGKCRKTFTRKYHLERHMTHTSCNGGEVPEGFACEVCQKVFTRIDNLRMHLRAHLGQKPKSRDFQCPYCEKGFTGSSLLNIHVRTHTKEKPYKCDFCEKGFPSSGALTKHRRVHTGERPYSCPMCGNRFAAKETLNRHVKTHTGKRDHKCNICGKDFIQNTQLRAHMFHHNDENALVCDLCGKKFNRKTRLTEHISYIHLKKKMPECHMCKKTFMRREDLNRHVETHIGERVHSCLVCEKKFVTRAAVKIHMRVHQIEEPARCSFCQKNFLRMDCLVRHLRMKHREMLKQIIVEAETKKIRRTLGADEGLDEVEIIYETIDDNEYLTNKEQVDIVEMSTNEDITDEPAPIFLDDNILKQRIAELLQIVIEENVLKEQGFGKKSIDEVLCSVLEKCCRPPLKKESISDDSTRIRENTKILFSLVLDEDHITTLLNNYTVDEVITIVIRMSK